AGRKIKDAIGTLAVGRGLHVEGCLEILGVDGDAGQRRAVRVFDDAGDAPGRDVGLCERASGEAEDEEKRKSDGSEATKHRFPPGLSAESVRQVGELKCGAAAPAAILFSAA